ncbi:MAG: M20 family metallopeptidase [Ferrovibrio sp.]|uniref:M20 aminoacylase family protein n=1 Tax=Ferrovibrio sp. TaxID=1917215 RepID=UPI00262A19F4|nr:M20 aminoacylase family protein [Ferrovibrio sp.]MCW0235516.1 M20 family metallopeptidase [Ferrovibrio sp.]
MKLIDEIVANKAQLTAWRRDLHMHPETAFEEHRTADFVARTLESFGMPVHRGLAKTGVVGTLKAGTGNRAIGLRADMDALDLIEMNEFGHKSRHEGKMHGCGHDGHTIMLLGAAQHLAKAKNFDGIVHFIFQPAEENLAGGKVMVDEGLFEKFPCETVFGMHNMPGVDVGQFGVRVGPMMASADMFWIKVKGVGAHGAYPHRGVDPVLIAAEIVMALQHIVGRNVDPMHSAVVSCCQIQGGQTTNVIPEDVMIAGTTRAFLPEVQDMIESRLKQIATGIAAAHGASATVDYQRRYPPTINTADETELAARAAAAVVGTENVLRNLNPSMGAEDFAWMLREKPGAYVWVGNGAGESSCMVHNPRYDFNDDVLPIGASYWSRLVELALPVS